MCGCNLKKFTSDDIKNAPLMFKQLQKALRTQFLFGMCFAALQILCGVAIVYAAYVLNEVM